VNAALIRDNGAVCCSECQRLVGEAVPLSSTYYGRGAQREPWAATSSGVRAVLLVAGFRARAQHEGRTAWEQRGRHAAAVRQGQRGRLDGPNPWDSWGDIPEARPGDAVLCVRCGTTNVIPAA
jgi:hypothetical protein